MNRVPNSAPPGTLAVGLGAFAAYHLVVGALMAFAPRTFFTDVGPFGTLNTHYIRDLASYNAAIALALALAVRRPTWRVPILALVSVQFVLHSINHLIDIGRAHPVWLGYFDFATLALATLVLGWLWGVAVAEEKARSQSLHVEGATP